MKTKLFITGLALFAITTLGFSQNGNPQDRPGRNQGNQTEWVDENNDGICDNYENRTPGQGYGKGNGYRRGMNQGQPGKGLMNGQGRGRYFVDEDKNGVCDRYEETRKDEADKK